MAWILNLETAGTNCSVSLYKNQDLVAIREDNSPGYSHAELLHLYIEEVVVEAGIALADLQAIAVSKGPGSYTGLRIGVASAKGLCFALDIPLISIPTLESLARQLTPAEGLIVPLMDARRMEVYTAVFDSDHKRMAPTVAKVVDPDSFLELAQKGKVHFLGTGTSKCAEVLKHPNFIFYPGLFPSSREMGKLAFDKYQRQAFEDLAYFEPYYLKDFIAHGGKNPGK
ncbi:tRNA (adenosine(37)-N6)-threonylcarbamoyltransferase complex dimerization subunit type 1 TsaB [Robiginitalea sp. IMCC44478]|uniref:tRNA (adenosine(37)-N6)-threonylcarbamoyltransferase complex dimerization subunit type 1 TsaB n=1 Tax=Robiginitalea sp. IMCC44478 TaxID=3459122 RepID=UPI004041F93B